MEHLFPDKNWSPVTCHDKGCRCVACCDGMRSYKKIARARAYARNGEKIREANKLRARRKNGTLGHGKVVRHHPKGCRPQHRQALRYIRLACGCKDCGYHANAEALDFDHVRGTKFKNVTLMAGRASWSEIAAEIAKCEVVCANCHRIRTANRRQAKKTPAAA